MSTWYDVYCFDCKSHAGIQENHWQEECADLIANKDAIASMAEGMKAIDSILGWRRPSIRLSDHVSLPVEWFATHKDHKLVVINEYGSFYKECMKRFVCCGRCGNEWHYCHRKPEHEGECSGKRDEP